MNGEKGFNCENVGNLSDIYSLARSMDIALLTDKKKLKSKRTLCNEINAKQDGFNWLNSVAFGQKPYFDPERGQTMISIAFDYFVDAYPQPAIDYIYIDHTEGQPFQKDGQRMIKVWWEGFDVSTDEPIDNVKQAYGKEKITKETKEETPDDSEAKRRRERIAAEVQDQFRIVKEEEQRARLAEEDREKAELQRALREKEEKAREEKVREERERKERERKEREREEREKEEKEREKEREEKAREEREREEKERAAREKAAKERNQVERSKREAKEKEEEAKRRREEAERKRIEQERLDDEIAARMIKQRERERREKEQLEFQKRQQSDERDAKRPRIADEPKSDYQRLERPNINNANRQLINEAVTPCITGRVDRTCLLSDRNPYVVPVIDSAKFGQLTVKLGQGSYGKVYMTTKNYAVKCLQGKRDRPLQLSDNDVREMCLLRNLIHPNIVAVYQVAISTATSDPGCLNAVVLQLYDSSLSSVSVKGKRHSKLRCYVMYQAIRAVAFLHSRNIWHRDIKPHNYLINTNTNHVVLTDFGAAQGLSVSGNRYTKVITTPWFRAPEIFLGSSNYNAAIDVWALGMSWLYMVDFNHFKKEKDEEILAVIYKIAGYPSASNFPAALKFPNYIQPETNERFFMQQMLQSDHELEDKEISLILRMLQLNPDSRVTAFDALNDPYFDPVRAQVHRQYPSANLIAPTLSNCGAMLVAMQNEPVGNYIQSNDDKILLKEVFEWILSILKESSFRPSFLFLATSLCHRYLKKKYDNRFYIVAAACMQIAWKIDADYESKIPFIQIRSLYYLEKKGISVESQDLTALENDILRVLDMDLDRPTAFTFIEFLASYRVIGESVYKLIISSLTQLEINLSTINKTALQVAMFVLRQQTIDTNCKKTIEAIFPDFIA